jgi:plasmid stabilization system protein ParE
MDTCCQPDGARALLRTAAWWLAAIVGGVVWAVAAPNSWLELAEVLAGLAAVDALWVLLTLSRERRRADDWLRRYAIGDFVPPRYAWRARQLRAENERLRLAKTLRELARRAVESPGGGYASPRLTAAAAEHHGELSLLASKLERVDKPVTPLGVLRVLDLITDGTGPLWNPARSVALGETISSTLAVLTPESRHSREHPDHDGQIVDRRV